MDHCCLVGEEVLLTGEAHPGPAENLTAKGAAGESDVKDAGS